jgi:23S rRNA pseudouridine1911/1915/1917 synthase
MADYKLPIIKKIFRPKTLVEPTVLFSTNHLLIVNKPPGWTAVPTDSGWDEKSLIHHLRSQLLGGGSKSNYLNPLHRIDQPCSGLVVLGKTKKAGERIQPLWADGKVQKTYLVVLSDDHDQTNGWKFISGHMLQPKKSAPQHEKRTVQFTNEPYPNTKYCELKYRSLSPTLLEISTKQGARHMVRALLSFYGHTVAGDLRYGANRALEDQSVALHASSIEFPRELSLGTLQQRSFEAPIPETWRNYFGISQAQVDHWLMDSPGSV